jgi:hypothetical protein
MNDRSWGTRDSVSAKVSTASGSLIGSLLRGMGMGETETHMHFLGE